MPNYGDLGKSFVSIMVDSVMKSGDQGIVTTIDDIISCSESDLLNCCVNESDDFNVFDEADCNLDGMENCETFTDFSDLMLDSSGLPYSLHAEPNQQQTSAAIIPIGTKRTAIEAFSTANGTGTTVDHNYHVPSKKTFTGETDEQIEENPADIKHLRYLERRRKNNAASKRSRETKKNRMVEMEQEAVQLERDNESLQRRLVELDRLSKLMKSLLVQKVSVGSQ